MCFVLVTELQTVAIFIANLKMLTFGGKKTREFVHDDVFKLLCESFLSCKLPLLLYRLSTAAALH